jgi:hypothetical protein
MNPVPPAGATPSTGAVTDPVATANTEAEFQQAFSQALSQVGTAVVSIALEDLIQISQEDL